MQIVIVKIVNDDHFFGENTELAVKFDYFPRWYIFDDFDLKRYFRVILFFCNFSWSLMNHEIILLQFLQALNS